jgi:ferritin
MLDFVVDRGETVTLSAIEKPVSDFKSATDVFERTLAHERKVTSLIHNLYAQATKENDYASMEMLQWFIKEQVEEEKNASLILDQLKMVGDKGSSLVMLDHRIGKRGE